MWAEDLGAGVSDVRGNGIAVDRTGNVYTTGYFNGTGNFGGGASTHNLTSSNSGVDTNAYVSKLDANGNFVFADDLGAGATNAIGNGIAVNSTGNVYTTGFFLGTGNFDGGAGTHNLTSSNSGADTNAYVSKLDANGGFVFADDLGAGVGDAEGTGIAVDSTGNVYTTGFFLGTGNFDGGAGTHNLTSSNSGADTNAYVSKLDANGGFVFADDLGAGATQAGVRVNGIAVDSTGNVYTTGEFRARATLP